MNLIKVKPLALIALANTVNWVQAADLGNMEINSSIDQKLNADIPLNLAPNESTAGTRVKILSSKINSNGENKSPEIAINSDDGILKLTTKEAIHAPHIDIVLEVKTNKDTQYKQFSIDLNRASKGSPLIVSPKNSLDPTQATTATATATKPKYYRKKSQTTPTAPVNSVKPDAIKTENQPQIIDKANNPGPSQPITNQQADPVAMVASTDTPQQLQASSETAIKQPTELTAPPASISALKSPANWIADNIFNLLAFLAGILGVLILQKLFSPKPKKAKSGAKRHQRFNYEQYQLVQDGLPATAKQQSAADVIPEINGDVALFEQLLRTRMQQLQEINPPQATASSANNQQPVELDAEDEFGFDFALPGFALEDSKQP